MNNPQKLTVICTDSIVRIITTTISSNSHLKILPHHRTRKRSLSPDLLDDCEGFKRRRTGIDGSFECPTTDAANRHRVSATEGTSSQEGPKLSSGIRDPVIILRHFFKYLPQDLWRSIFEAQLTYFRSLNVVKRRPIFRTIFDFLFCRRVLHFSTELLKNFTPEEHVYILRKLTFCSQLKELDYVSIFPESYYVQTAFDGRLIENGLNRFHNLQRLKLIPSKQYLCDSYRVFPILGNSCPNLIDVTMFYSIPEATPEEPKVADIRSFGKCRKLQSLSLYSLGGGIESDFLVELLQNLKYLKFLYHRELANALMQIYFDCLKNGRLLPQFQLQSIFMEGPLLHFGYQKIYISSSNLVQIGMLCPNINHLTLLNPGCLEEPLEYFQNLNSLVLRDTCFETTLREPLSIGRLTNMRTLVLQKVTLHQSDIYLLSKFCLHLVTLEISDSNLLSSEDNHECHSRPLFPKIEKLIFVPSHANNFILQEEDEQTEVWNLSRNLITQLLSGAVNIKVLHVKLSEFYDDTADHVLNLVSKCHQLEDLMLWSLPKASYTAVARLVKECKCLTHLKALHCWGLSQQDFQKCTAEFHYLL